MVKTYFKLLELSGIALVLFLQPSGLMSQQLPDSCLAEFYPLNRGDYWEYQYMVGSTVQSLVTKKVVGDTVMSNGITYKMVEEFWQYNNERLLRFQRYDSSTVYWYLPAFDREFVWYELRKAVGEFWPTERPGFCDTSQIGRIESIRETQIFGELKTRVKIRYYCSRDTSLWISDELVKGIGAYYLGGEGDAQILQGAIINGKQYGVITHVQNSEPTHQKEEASVSSYPNPFNESTVIKYSIPSSDQVTVNIYDLKARLVKRLFNGEQTAGEHFVNWDGKNSSGKTVASGLYIVSVKGKNFYQSKFLTLLK
ncbi:T9SS type A sorting domain-containing protein [Candidatus Saccharibacteria bacterium]|nr:T9SS type A sorting domain-containing protein [Candidatus Saccharibacteria bacterium]NIU00707.1 T9SS type A sorting domain-containing protein [Nitrosopumilaceae archaeon]NIV03832.1 T9SS type A sorting domain-containing protein [Calditrichia bacterium]NIW79351.1 T9SS type A sorting domain-containing protein [Calditrichia bacterium]NIX61309.1 T9SS type A sorting domain-containing protein [Nitrosopumilaceae archaeon]